MSAPIAAADAVPSADKRLLAPLLEEHRSTLFQVQAIMKLAIDKLGEIDDDDDVVAAHQSLKAALRLLGDSCQAISDPIDHLPGDLMVRS